MHVESVHMVFLTKVVNHHCITVYAVDKRLIPCTDVAGQVGLYIFSRETHNYFD